MMMAVSFQRNGRLYYLDPGPYQPRSATRCWCPPTPVRRWPSASGRRSGSTRTSTACRSARAWRPTTHLSRDETNRRSAGRGQGRRPAARPRARPADEGRSASTTSTRRQRRSPSTSPPRTGSTSASWSGTWPARLRARVELRQIGPRDEARLQGGIGPCGRDLCCATFLKDFEPVSVRMAKDQDLPVNPLRIAGACGRLMCCLKYEHPLYQDFRAKAPRLGRERGDAGGAGHGRRAQRARPTRSW